jgi:hypothetical protein
MKVLNIVRTTAITALSYQKQINAEVLLLQNWEPLPFYTS